MPTTLADLIQKHFDLAFLGASAWILMFVAASILYRKSRGKEIFPRKPSDAVFYEGYASGCSHRNILTMIGGARNCLQVAVTPTELLVRPFFPFNLMFLPEIYGLEHKVPRGNIRSIERKGAWFWKRLRVEFVNDGADEALSLTLRDPDEFLRALGRQ